ncbi:MAG: sulfotransferase [Candidatus Dadabacteria bacterium]|nr:MAG: sulfotransferase [Candidatus Dadabacteria bacterium]
MMDLRPALQGIIWSDWWRVLRENRFRIAPRFWGRAIGTSAVALLNSVNAWVEKQTYGAQIDEARVVAPIFILGHWRSGTTWLHELLSQDARFAAPTLFQVWNPHTFLTTESRTRRLAGANVRDDRGFDRVQIGFDAASEDEFALWHGSGRSDFMSWTFPRSAAFYDRYLDGVALSDAERKAWRAAFDTFLRKLTVRYPERTLLLKSPQHTARAALLAEMYPDARFVYIHRHPVDVFRSTQRLYSYLAGVSCLQINDWYDAPERILQQGRRVFSAWAEARGPLAPRVAEVAYDDLVQQPLATLERIYDRLDLPDYEAARPSFETYLARQSGYRTNSYEPLQPAMLSRLREAWRLAWELGSYQDRAA